MIPTFYLRIEVDVFSDDSDCELLRKKLKSIAEQICSEPIVDAVKVIREDFVYD